MSKRLSISSLLVAVITGLTFIGCSSSENPPPSGSTAEDDLAAEVKEAVRRFRVRDPSISRFFDSSRGYAVFPSVSKGAVVVGGAHGEGYVYESGDRIGYSTLSQGTIGLQLGGQEYSEIIFFKDEAALNDFRRGNFEFSGQASAVAVEAGASADASYESGVAVFTMTKAGLMFEASIGGQSFTYRDL